MNEFLKMDIFFVVATGGVVVITTLVAIALFYLIRFLRTLDHIGEHLAEETELVRGDLQEVRAKAKEEGLKFSHLTNFFSKTHKRIRKRKKD